MKLLFLTTSIVLVGLAAVTAQTLQPIATIGAGPVALVPGAANYTVVEQGPHSRVWARVDLLANNLGRASMRTNRYVELQTGLGYLSNGQYLESQEIVEGYPGGAVARQGQIQMLFPNDLYSEPIDAQTAAGRFRSSIVCLSYADPALQTNVLIAEIQPCQGEIIAPNQVIYPRAFSNDVNASVRYTYRKSGWEQDILIDDPGSLPTPEACGLDSSSPTLVLQVITEFLAVPPPRTADLALASPLGALRDQAVDWGPVRMAEGQALLLGQPTNSTPVPTAKHWVLMPDQRQFLVEEVPFAQVLRELLSRSGGASLDGQARKMRGIASLDQLRKLTPSKPSAKRMELASAQRPERGLLIDYAITMGPSATNFTFLADSTYYISGPVTLAGTTVCQGGSCLKFTNSPSAKISLTGPLQINAGQYSPVIMSSKDDNTIGSAVNGSTGSPTNYNGATYIQDNSNQNNTYRYLRLLYAGTGLSAPNFSNGVWHCQFVKCGTAINATNNGSVVLRNVLIAQCTSAVVTTGTLKAEHITADQCTTLLAGAGSTGFVTNSLITATGVTNVTCYNSPQFSSGNGVYQTVGAANYFLADFSTNRNAGLTNITSALAHDLALRTTYPPILYSNVVITADTTLWPQALRDQNARDLGFHYDPIDYLCSCCVSNATLTLTNGVVICYFDSIGLWLHNGSRLSSGGSPLQRNYFAHYNLVQEQPVYLAATNSVSTSVPINPWHTDSSRNPSIWLRFSTFVAPVGAVDVIYTGGGGWEISTFNVQDCEAFGGGATWNQNYDPATSVITLRNNLFQYAYVDVESGGPVTTYNNLFRGTTNYTIWFFNVGTNQFAHADNAYDACAVALDGTVGHNAYLNGATLLSGNLQTNDITTNLTWVAGPLGGFYQPTNSPLINKGSRTADLAGLYHYTTQTNQVKETNSVVDISYHYVAVDASGKPLDWDADNVPDYLEDADGDGNVENGERNWRVSESGTTGLPGLQVFTPIK